MGLITFSPMRLDPALYADVRVADGDTELLRDTVRLDDPSARTAFVERVTARLNGNGRPLEELESGLLAVYQRAAGTESVSTTAPLGAPAFPLHVLSSFVRPLVEEGAAAIGVAPELIAVPLLGFAAATIGNTAVITLKDGWTEYPVLYLAVVAPPGAAKTPAIALARYPLGVLQKAAFERYQEEVAEYKREIARWAAAAGEADFRGPEPEKPRLEHFFSTDATLEALAVMLGPETPGLAMLREELVSWVKSCDAYRGGRGADRQSWLSLWSSAPLKIDRKTREPIYVQDPVVCVIGGIQPDLLTELNDEASRRDGFIERIAWSYPDPRSSGWTDATVSEEAKQRALAVFCKLRHVGEAREFRLSAAARPLWIQWQNANREQGDAARGVVQGCYAKLPALAARLALVLHLLTHPDNTPPTISADTLSDALELAEYFRAHAHCALAHFGAVAAVPDGLAGRILRALQRTPEEWVSKAALHGALGGHVPAAELNGALAGLEAQRYIERREVPTAGRPSEEWRITSREKTKLDEEGPEAPLASSFFISSQSMNSEIDPDEEAFE